MCFFGCRTAGCTNSVERPIQEVRKHSLRPIGQKVKYPRNQLVLQMKMSFSAIICGCSVSNAEEKISKQKSGCGVRRLEMLMNNVCDKHLCFIDPHCLCNMQTEVGQLVKLSLFVFICIILQYLFRYLYLIKYFIQNKTAI